MPNQISLAEKYTPVLDEIYFATSKTAILDAPEDNVKWKNANKCEVLKVKTDGLGNYSRNSGYVKGSVTADWEDMTLTQDRGIEFSIDIMDDDETFDKTAMATLSQTVKKASEETDAYRFAKYATATGVTVASADIASSTNVADLIDIGIAQLDDESVPTTGRILFINAKNAYPALKKSIVRTTMNGENGISRTIETYEGMLVVKVPTRLFNTGITLNNGQTKFGFEPATGSYGINFMIIQAEAVLQPIKRNALKTFGPDVNQDTDGTKIQYRRYHDAFVYENKVAGIYVHKRATAN